MVEKKCIGTIKNEMRKAIEKGYLKQDERVLINKFVDKIKNELNNVD